MASFTAFLVVYLFGGLTFLPLVIALAIYLTTRPVLPDPSPAPVEEAASATAPEKKRAGSFANDKKKKDDYNYDGLVLPGDDVKALEKVRREHALGKGEKGEKGEKSGSKSGAKHGRTDRSDDFATAGYFAVHRKYVAMGVNSKPIEPGSVGPVPVAPPSPSVYQTFFRNMLNKKSDADAAVEVSNAASPRPKNARNMYYVVLRHGHLILFDDDQQVDVRHVIKLADHDVRISSGAGSSSTSATPEGELFIKRSAIHLAPKTLERAKAHNAPIPQPWYFYCENGSEKEDFYFSLLRSQKDAPQPHDIDVRHLTALMERLHASPEAAEMRWLNAVIGRLFLGVYKTPDILHFVQSKIVTKLARVPRPSFIASLVVQRVDVGDTTPQITSPRLKSLTAEGECIVEADVRYSGRFEIDVAAILRMSTPIGQQEVKTSLAVVLTHLEGHILFKIKAPPSNRIWFSFRHMPKVEMDIRPIVMARQLTWPVFLQMIEGKIKEAIAESIVLPFWDDTPFFSTEKKAWRGGLWEDPTDKAHHDGTAINTDDCATAASTSDVPGGEENVSPAVQRLRRLSKAATASSSSSPNTGTAAPGGDKAQSPSLLFKKMGKKNQSATDVNDVGASTASPKLPPRTTTSDPVVATDKVHAEAAAAATATATAQSPPALKSTPTSSSAISWLSSGTLRKRASNISMSGTEAGSTTDGPDAGAAGASGATGAAARHSDRPASSSRNDDNNDDKPGQASSDDTTAAAAAATAAAETHDTSSNGEGGRTPHSPASQPAAPRAATFAGPSSPTRPRSSQKSADRAATIAASPDGGEHNAKTGAVLAAAMTGAAQSAKRWGINALQRRATAVAERKAKAELELRKGSAELDLTKPMGGGIPLPPLGEPLPLPSELAHKAESTQAHPPAAAANAGMKIKRKKVQSQSHHAQPAAAAAAAAHRHGLSGNTSSSSPSTSNESVGRRRTNTDATSSSAQGSSSYPGSEQQDFLVVAAPSDSEPDDDDSDDRPPLPDRRKSSIIEERDEGEGAGDDGADAQWGELAESVMSAFLKEGSSSDATKGGRGGAAAGTAHHPAPPDGPLITFDTAADTARPIESQRS